MEEQGEFAALGMDVGYVYGGPAILDDIDERALRDEDPDGGGSDPRFENSEAPGPLIFIPGTRPGQRMPHIWLEQGGRRLSTYDIGGRGRFILISDDAAGIWESAAAHAGTACSVPVDLVLIGEGPGRWRNDDRTWFRQRFVSAEGAVLVRPDGHIGWRSADVPEEPGATLTAALRSILQTQRQCQ